MIKRNILKYSNMLPNNIKKIINPFQDFIIKNMDNIGFYNIRLPSGKSYLFYLDIKERTDFNMYINNNFEVSNSKLFIKKIKNKNTFFDIGGYRGYYSILAHQYMKKNAKIIAFEPVNKNYEYISRSVIINNINNIKIEKLAISDKNRTQTMYLSSSESTHSLAKADKNFFMGDFKQLNKIKVKTSTLDKYIKDNKSEPDILKIDVEGAELNVLRGFKEYLNKRKPEMLLEVHERKFPAFKYSKKEFYNYINSLGYNYRLIRNGELIEIPKNFEKKQYTIYLK